MPQIGADGEGGVLVKRGTREEPLENLSVVRATLRLPRVHAVAVAEAGVLHAPPRLPFASRNHHDVWRSLVLAAGTCLNHDDWVAPAALPRQRRAPLDETRYADDVLVGGLVELPDFALPRLAELLVTLPICLLTRL